MKKECPHCSCYAEPTNRDNNEYCVMCDEDINIDPSWFNEDGEEDE